MNQRDNKCRWCRKGKSRQSIIFEKWNPISKRRFARIFCNNKCLEKYKGSEKEKVDDLERKEQIEGYIETWGDKGFYFHASKEEIQKISKKWGILELKKTTLSQPFNSDNGTKWQRISLIIGTALVIGGGIGWYFWKRKKQKE